MFRQQRSEVYYRFHSIVHGKEFGDGRPRLCRGEQLHEPLISVRASTIDSHHGCAGRDIQPRNFVSETFPELEGSR
jgi:hypothetical protein